MSLHSINPTNGQTVAEYREHSRAELNDRVAAADAASRRWRKKSFAQRSAALQRLAKILCRRQKEFAQLMALEMGKPLAQGSAEIDKCAWLCEFFANHGASFLEERPVPTEARRSFIAFEPLGVILAVMPWNFPFWQVFRAAVPALMAGNGMVLKHASNVTGCAEAIGAVFQEADLEPDLFAVGIVSSDRVNELIEHPLIRGVTLTGSTEAGRAVASKAGSVLKKVVLELGGSDPYIILADANLERAAELCVQSRLINSGQSCIAAKRFIVVAEVWDSFRESFVERMRAQKVGDPLQNGVTVGPLARPDLREALHGQVQRSVAQGAAVILGGEIPSGSGAFYPPTVLQDVTPDMVVACEETFGPVAALLRAGNEEEALTMANQSSFGLGAAVFTEDRARGEDIAAHRLEAGCCFVNDFVKSDPRLPFGGVKESGYGRELGEFGAHEFVNIKTVWVG